MTRHPTDLTTEFSAHPQTALDHRAVEALYDMPIPEGTKGLPLEPVGLTLGDVARSGWNVLHDGLPMPSILLRHSALETNAAAMADYCRANDSLLCPHGKTTMAPQLFRRQIDGGAWGLTAATPAHLRVYRRFGVQRILYANPLVEHAVIDWVAAELSRSPDLEFLCLVDSVDGVNLLDERLSSHSDQAIDVLVEIGYTGGRCGARSAETAQRVAAAVDASRSLTLRGIECFEGQLSRDSSAEGLARIDAYLQEVGSVATKLRVSSSLSSAPSVLVSAGGSAYFDRVVHAFVTSWSGAPLRVVLRSGCYLTHDGGFYDQVSPLAGRRAGGPVLENAIEIWSAVLSRPEPELAIIGMGRRDAPTDMTMPIPLRAVRRNASTPEPLDSASVRALNDQHAYLVVAPDSDLRPGDLVGCAISHPCTAFDRWRVIPIVDDDNTIRDAIVTFF